MKRIFTLLLVTLSYVGFAQIGGNEGATRDENTTSIQELDVRNAIVTYAAGSELIVRSTNSAVEIDQVRVFDINGQMISAEQVFGTQWNMNMSGKAAGIYIVAIEANNKSFAKRVFVTGK